ncbi:MAG: uroporphyrinogen-III synthase [Pseudomonadota bacterium]
MQFIVTRPEADAKKLIAKLKRAGHRALAAPLIRIHNLPGITLPPTPWQAILVNSANSIRALTALPGSDALISVPVLAVGPASAKAAKSAGFTDIRTAHGDLDALAAMARAELDPAGSALFYPSGTVISGDLKSKLEGEGFSCTRLPLYDAEPARELPENALQALKRKTAEGVVLFSPRTARIWAKCLADAHLTGAASRLTHCCLSTAVAEALAISIGPDVTLKNVIIAPEPNEDSLLRAIGGV